MKKAKTKGELLKLTALEFFRRVCGITKYCVLYVECKALNGFVIVGYGEKGFLRFDDDLFDLTNRGSLFRSYDDKAFKTSAKGLEILAQNGRYLGFCSYDELATRKGENDGYKCEDDVCIRLGAQKLDYEHDKKGADVRVLFSMYQRDNTGKLITDKNKYVKAWTQVQVKCLKLESSTHFPELKKN